MYIIQFVQAVPDWARERGLTEVTFDILEQIVLNREDKDIILRHVEYGDACCIISALEYGDDKGLL